MMTLLSLQREIWRFHKAAVGLCPPTVLVAAKNGGIVLGAFAAETDEMVAFLFSFLGRAPGFVSITERNGERRNRYLLQKSTPTLLAQIGIEA